MEKEIINMTKGVKLWVSCQEEYLESCARKFFSVQLSHLIYLRYSWKVLPLLPSLPTHAKAGLQARQAPLITQRANTSEWCGAAGANFQILTLPQEEMVMIKNNNNKIYRGGAAKWDPAGKSVTTSVQAVWLGRRVLCFWIFGSTHPGSSDL